MIIGVAAVIVMVAIGTGARTSIEQQIRSAGSNVITVNAGSGRSGSVAREQRFGAGADPVGALVRINSQPFRVIGVLTSKGQA